MTNLIIKFPVSPPTIEGKNLIFQFGNGVSLVTQVPNWVESVGAAEFQILINVEGSPDHD